MGADAKFSIGWIMAAGLVKTDAGRVPVVRKVVYSGLVCGCFFGVFELALWITGFQYGSSFGPVVVADGVRQEERFRRADGTQWAPAPNTGRFNSAGFIGPVIGLEKPPGCLRIAAVGDSCTYWGSPTYPERLREILAERLDRPVEVLNAGVAGYSTYQGKKRLEYDVLPYRPDIVVIYFGWNDHWLWRTRTDAEVNATSRSLSLLERLSGRCRSAQVALLFRDTLHSFSADSARKATKVFRVPPDEYRQNLDEMIHMVRSSGGVPYLITAPTDLTDAIPLSDFEILQGIDAARYPTPYQLHQEYVEITRQAARESGAVLVDAAEHFAGATKLIMDDHIHLTPLGIEEMSLLLSETVLRNLQ